MPSPPWQRSTGIDHVIARWHDREAHARCFTAHRILEAESAEYAAFPADIDRRLVDALHTRGIKQLYRHQRQAIDAARAGKTVVIATPTASGKSLCFHLPILDAIAKDPNAAAIYLYPTKALSRDQEQGLHSLIADAKLPIAATVYDGDTPGDARRAARQRSQLVMTNPDMLHAGILPQHASWARTFQNLRYIVVDELHTYRGVFGSHVGQVLHRLLRVAAFHGANPTIICATATIGNPAEHAARLTGKPIQDIEVVTECTAPRGQRRVLVHNPPVVNAELGVRASYIKTAVRLTGDLLEARVRTIVFGGSRNSVEIMLKYLRDRFASVPSIHDAIVAYRGGYLPDQRRQVERGLRAGEVLCVVATSALELGIDVGDLDAVVCAGYPGSLAEVWQRFGRAGRRAEESVAVMVASSAPLDQYVATHPELLLDGHIEEAQIDPDNTEILIQHLKCAAFELPFLVGERFAGLSPDDTEAALGYLGDSGVVHRAGDRFHWSSDAFPASDISLRRVGWDNFVIIDVDREDALAELDWHSTPTMLHEQAIYQHDGLQYQVERLDYDNHKAFVRRVEPDYFTTAQRHVKIRVLEDEATSNLTLEDGPTCAPIGWGEICRTEKVVGYKKVKFHSHENAGYGDVRLPEVDMHTSAFWLTVPAQLCESLGRSTAIEGLRGIANALELVATLALMCDPRDIGRVLEDAAPGASEVTSGAAHGEAFSATAYLYDNVPGGVGLAERIYERASDLLAQTAALISSCACQAGCPCCVGATAADHTAAGMPDFNRRRSAQQLLAALGLSQPAPPTPSTPGPRLKLVT